MRRALTITGAAASLSLVGAALLIPTAGASGTFVVGTATATAQAFALMPHTGGFAYTITGGSSIADYRGTLAQAESQSLDFGLIGTSLTAEGCDGSKPTISSDQLPQPLIAESDKGDASKSADQAGIAQSGVLAVSGHETVSATTVPAATATFDGGNLTIPGLLAGHRHDHERRSEADPRPGAHRDRGRRGRPAVAARRRGCSRQPALDR